jgi:hypothetical protein
MKVVIRRQECANAQGLKKAVFVTSGTEQVICALQKKQMFYLPQKACMSIAIQI